MRGQRGVPELVNIFHDLYFTQTGRRYLYIGNGEITCRPMRYPFLRTRLFRSGLLTGWPF
jgi:hypothetical protein